MSTLDHQDFPDLEFQVKNLISNFNESENHAIFSQLAKLVSDPRIPHGAYSEKKEQIATPPSDDVQSSSEVSQQHIQGQLQFQQHGRPQANQDQNLRQNNLPPLPPPNFHQFPKQHPIPLPMPAQPSNIMLPPLPPHPGYSNVKREGVVIDDQGRAEEDDEEDEDKEPSFAALGGRPRSVDFQRPRQRREIDEDGHFLIHVSHVYKRAAQEMTDVQTTRVIQVSREHWLHSRLSFDLHPLIWFCVIS